MEKDKFDELLISVLKKWEETKDASAILKDNTGILELNEENQKIFELVCKEIDNNSRKMKNLQEYKKEGGSREEWLEEQFDEAASKVGLSEEQKNQVKDLVRVATENVTEQLAKEGSSNPVEINKESIGEKESSDMLKENIN